MDSGSKQNINMSCETFEISSVKSFAKELNNN